MSDLTDLVAKAMEDIKCAQNIEEIDNVRSKYFGKKGYLTSQITDLRELPIKERPSVGAIINEAKKQIQEAINARKLELHVEKLNTRLSEEIIDVSLPGRHIGNGALHPITQIIDRIESCFTELGFSIITGLEIEDDYHNFDALNIPPHHPTRSNRDTFWFDSTRLLRTQTSSVQIHIMKNRPIPIRIISSGRVYRNDYDQNHTPMFHQMEGLILDRHISFANLKSTLYNFLHNFFEENLQIRFRTSYFPFTEPSAEVDIMGKNGKWLEILGCGMIHPNVLRNINIDPEIYSGFAFGMGIERLTMLHYGVTDLRSFFENNLRFLKQFK